MIVIIDYDIGNVGAIKNMLARLGYNSIISKNPHDIKNANKIILPGNGSYDSCLKNLRATRLVPVLEKKVLVDKTPILGICVGAQMLGKSSEEGEEPGLGWIDMNVKKFQIKSNFPVPNMGWRKVLSKKNHHLTKFMDDQTRFYFVHSYYMTPENKEDILILSNYDHSFVAGILHKNIIGVQFHPEKSHRFGKSFLKSFVDCNFYD